MALKRRSGFGFCLQECSYWLKSPKSLNLALLEFSTAAYAPTLRCDSDALERVQRRVTRTIWMRSTFTGTGDSVPSYTKRCKLFNLETLELRRLRFDLSAAHRILNTSSSTPAFPQRTVTRARSNGKIAVPASRTGIRRKSFHYRVATICQSINCDILRHKKPSVFRQHLDKIDLNSNPLDPS